ncbi:MAG: ATP-binding protein, partial [Dehalococcoidia bacterium]
MNELQNWPAGNDRYLAAALAWLRLLLARQAERLVGASPPSFSPAPPPTPMPAWGVSPRQFSANGGSPTSDPGAVAVLTIPEPETDAAADRQLDAAAAEMMAAEALDPPPALLLLAQRLGLSRFEHEVLLLCAAGELDTRIPALCARAQDDPRRDYPTFALALALFADPAWDVLSPERGRVLLTFVRSSSLLSWRRLAIREDLRTPPLGLAAPKRIPSAGA